MSIVNNNHRRKKLWWTVLWCVLTVNCVWDVMGDLWRMGHYGELCCGVCWQLLCLGRHGWSVTYGSLWWTVLWCVLTVSVSTGARLHDSVHRQSGFTTHSWYLVYTRPRPLRHPDIVLASPWQFETYHTSASVTRRLVLCLNCVFWHCKVDYVDRDNTFKGEWYKLRWRQPCSWRHVHSEELTDLNRHDVTPGTKGRPTVVEFSSNASAPATHLTLYVIVVMAARHCHCNVLQRSVSDVGVACDMPSRVACTSIKSVMWVMSSQSAAAAVSLISLPDNLSDPSSALTTVLGAS